MRILYVMPYLGNGGVEKMTYEWIRRLQKKGNYHFDILVNEIINDSKYLELFNNLDVSIYQMPYSQIRLDKKIPILKNILLKNKYDIIHIHSCFAFDFWILKEAKKCGISIRIAHSHNAIKFEKITTKLLDYLSKPFIRYYATELLACSYVAGYGLFGKNKYVEQNLRVIFNGIDSQTYKFDIFKREKIRNELNLNNKFVVGSVGRLSKQKNYSLLINIFEKIKSIRDDSILLLVGSGEDKPLLEKQAKSLNIDKNIIFYGESNNVADLLQSMDVFVLTSLYEGLGISLIEAQFCQLPCVASNTITDEVNISGNVKFMDLNDSLDRWAQAIIESEATYNRIDSVDNFSNSIYDIEYSTDCLQNIYESNLKEG